MNDGNEWIHGEIPSTQSDSHQIPFPYSYHFRRVLPRIQSQLSLLQQGEYVRSIQTHMPEKLISSKNYQEITELAAHFNHKVTSFFGFESRLGSSEARSDYMFAVSSKQGEREALYELLQHDRLPDGYLQKREWQQVKEFVSSWVDPTSVLYKDILGMWFEFDTAYSPSETPVPCIFLHVPCIRYSSATGNNQVSRLLHQALPLLTGGPLSEKLEMRLIQALQALPGSAVLFNIGVMLSRADAGVRLVLTRIQPEEIVPYLESLGWTDQDKKLESMIQELNTVSSRLVLHIHITEQGVHQKIGIECSFSTDQYHQEPRWNELLSYLVTKGICCQEKKTALLEFLGVEQENPSKPFTFSSYMMAVHIPDQEYSRALVRFISHIKLCYTPGQQMEAKAYPGVRLFGQPQEGIGQYQ